MISTLAVIAKEPVPGRVKTRLIGTCSAEQASDLAAAALRDTFAALDRHPCDSKIIVLDGQAPDWFPADWSVVEQSDGGLDDRLSAGFDGFSDGPALLVGMDTPQLRTDQLGFDVDNFDACLGPATDGGYWAIGFADPRRARECIQGVPMSTDTTGIEQYRRMTAAGLSVQILPTLTDVDTADTADQVAEIAPHVEFSLLWQRIRRY